MDGIFKNEPVDFIQLNNPQKLKNFSEMLSESSRKRQSSSSASQKTQPSSSSPSKVSKSSTSESRSRGSSISAQLTTPEKSTTSQQQNGHGHNNMNVSTASTTAPHELPFSKIRSIMTSTPETMRANEEGLFAMTKAAEAFIAMLAKGAFDRSKGKLIMYSNLADFVQDSRNLSHIHEMVPRKVRFSTVEHAVRDAKTALKNGTK